MAVSVTAGILHQQIADPQDLHYQPSSQPVGGHCAATQGQQHRGKSDTVLTIGEKQKALETVSYKDPSFLSTIKIKL